MRTRLTCRQERDGRFLGYLNDYPHHWTQGERALAISRTISGIYCGCLLETRLPASGT